MKIYDCFIFFNELELLELRLMTLYPYVDYFVLVEAGITHSGKNKKFYYEENMNVFKEYADKIVYIKLDTLPYGNDAWKNENYNRNAIQLGLADCSDDDYVMISDVDEIPNPEAIMLGIKNKFNLFTLKQKLFYYYVNCLQNQEWFGTVITLRKNMKTPQELRSLRNGRINTIDNGGWHYTFLGGNERIKLKLESYAETQTNNSKVRNDKHILECLESGTDLFHRPEAMFKKTFINLEDIGHKELNEWVLKYKNMIKL